MDARQTIQHLGGNRFVTMTGAREFLTSGSELRFRLRRGAKDDINLISITLKNDLYEIKFYRFHHASHLHEVASVSGVYADQLQDVFTSHTGLATHL